ncbi:hypothetical protein CRX72_15850 [Pantoea sp. BRM17]|nr:hypothetical protein CRX72_15850 [Pantoea sp. BRM17]
MREMAAGAKALSGDDSSIAVSGYAGPDGGEDGTPAGTVWFAWGLPDGTIQTCCQRFSGEATILGDLLLERKLTVTTAESCTSGWVGSTLAAVGQSSQFYSSGFITYTDQAKHRVLNVSEETLARDPD